MIADACEMLLKGANAIKRLAKRDLSLGRRILAVIDDMVANMRTAFQGIDAKELVGILSAECKNPTDVQDM